MGIVKIFFTIGKQALVGIQALLSGSILKFVPTNLCIIKLYLTLPSSLVGLLRKRSIYDPQLRVSPWPNMAADAYNTLITA